MKNQEQEIVNAAIELHGLANMMKVIAYSAEELGMATPAFIENYKNQLDRHKENYHTLRVQLAGSLKGDLVKDVQYLSDFFTQQEQYLEKTG